MAEDDQAPILKLLLIEKAEESYRTLIFEQFLSCAEEVNKIWTSIPVSPPFGSRLTDIPIPLIVEEGELEEKCAPSGYLHNVRKKKSDFGAQYPEAELPDERTEKRLSGDEAATRQGEEKEPADLITACEDKAQQPRRSSGEEKRRRSPLGPPSETGKAIHLSLLTPSQVLPDELNVANSNFPPLDNVTSEDKNVNIPSPATSSENVSKNVTSERSRGATVSNQSSSTPCKASSENTAVWIPRLSTPTSYEPADKDNHTCSMSAAREASLEKIAAEPSSGKTVPTTSWLDNIDFLSDAYMTMTPKETIGDVPDVLTPLTFMSDLSDSDNPILSTAHIESWDDDKDAFLLNGIFVRDASDDVTDPDEITQPKREPISLNLPTFPSLCDQSVRMDEITVPEEAKMAIWSHGTNIIQSNQAIRLLHSTLGQQLGNAIMNCHRASSLAYLYIPLAELSVTVARIIVDHFNEWLDVLLSKQLCISHYYLRRAELVKDIIAMPHLEDCRLALYWMDVQEYESCRERLQQIEEFYLTMHEEVRRNWSSLYEGRKIKCMLDY